MRTGQACIEYLNSTVWATLRKSPIHNIGVFAIRNIPKGTCITDMMDYRVRPRQNKLSSEEMNKVYPEIRKLILDRTAFNTDSDIMAFYSPNADAHLQSWMNHSDTPNTTGTHTLRNINKGEELTESFHKIAGGPLHPVSKAHFKFLTRKRKQRGGTRKHHINTYYQQRKDFHYYKRVQSMLFKLPFTSILDVGSRKSPVMEHLDSSIYKAMLDLKPIPPQPGMHMITADFYKWKPNRHYDVALCLQVLEHLDRPKEFVQKLFRVAPTVIISVPYKWAKGDCKYHVQDPIDEQKILSWTGREPDEKHIVTDGGKRRIICLYS